MPAAASAALLDEAARLERAGRLEEAAATYQRLLARWPELPDCWYNLGLLQRRLGHFEAALGSYGQALERGVSRPEEVHLNRGVIFADCLRQEAAAEGELRAALELNPRYLPALQNLGNLYEDLGRRDEARELYGRVLALAPQASEVLARLAQLAPIEGPQDPLIARLRSALTAGGASAADQASLGFALARTLDAAGAYPEAFAAAEAANRASRASLQPPARYDRLAHERLIDALISAFPHPDASKGGAADVRPIFICGMWRSGSTLAEQLLASHSAVTAGGELELLPQLVQSSLAPFPQSAAALSAAGAAQLGVRYRRGIAALFPGARHVTDKRPDNYLLIGLIKRLLPEARIVHTTRDALDTCLSVFFLHLDPQLAFALDLLDIGHYFRQYRRLMAHWKSLFGEDILDFSYDSLVHDPRPALERLLAFCELPWEEACLTPASRGRAVKTASVWQVREPLYQRASGRSRHYRGELAALAAYLSAPGP
ncbi:MAG: tetratricopeptide repeat-containing sulfotransferase family protein [Steroidobacteraceae bacterium]